MKKWYNIKNQSNGITDVYLFDEIGGWGISAQSFVKDVQAIKGNITLHINSPGGSIFEGLAIYNVLAKLNVDVVIEGLAASMASVIAMAGKTIKMSKNSIMMIHKPWTGICGDSDELRKAADLLDVLENQLIDIYSTATSMETSKIKDLIADETWLNPEQALELGFCDEIVETIPVKNTFTANMFKNQEKYNQWLAISGQGLNDGKRCPKDELQIKNQEKQMEQQIEQILSLLGVDSLDAAIEKIKELLKDTEALEVEVASKTIELDIQAKKLLPAQKAFAKQLLSYSRKTYEDYLGTLAGADLTKPVGITVGVPHEQTYQALLDNPAEYCKLMKENPALVAELKEKHDKGGR